MHRISKLHYFLFYFLECYIEPFIHDSLIVELAVELLLDLIVALVLQELMYRKSKWDASLQLANTLFDVGCHSDFYVCFSERQ